MRSRGTIAAALAAALTLLASTSQARPSGPVRALACAPTDQDAAAALVGDSLWVTGDGGRSWTRAAVLPASYDGGETEDAVIDHGGDDETPDVIPDFDAETFEEQHRVEAAEVDLRATHGGDGGPGDEAVVALAVGDDGSFAALLGVRLFTGRPGRGVRERPAIPGALGVLIDARGGLWVAADQALLHFPPGAPASAEPRRFPLACSGPPARGSSPDEVLVPLRDGVAAIAAREGREPRVEVVRVGPVAAVAAVADGSWLAVARGRFARVRRDGWLEPLAHAPARVRRLLVARDLELWVLTADRNWSRGRPGSVRSVTALAVAVDAQGRTWIGTSHGPISPSLDQGPPPPGRPLPQVSPAPFLAGAMRLSDEEPGRPPCRPPINPAPTVRLVVGAGRGSTRSRELPGPVGFAGPGEEARIKTWFYAGIRLGWTFGPVAPTECLARLEAATELRDERRRRVAGLVDAWRRSAAYEAGARDVPEVIAARLERDRLAELIRITSGIDPREE